MMPGALWSLFYPENPLAGYVPEADVDMQGWGSTGRAFDYVLGLANPSLIIEVGTWKGASAIHMAQVTQAQVLCIDTWLGSAEMWPRHATLFKDLKLRHGWPQLYHTFATNVVHAKLEDRICPLPLPSSVAAQVLRRMPIQADVIYIDGSHDYRDVKNDLQDYWPLVTSGGFLFGDDYAWPGVKQAVHEVFTEGVLLIGGKYIVRKT